MPNEALLAVVFCTKLLGYINKYDVIDVKFKYLDQYKMRGQALQFLTGHKSDG